MEELDFRLHVIFLKRWRIYIFCGGGKEGKYLEKEKYLEKKKYLLEKKPEENIWRRKKYFLGGEEERRRKRRQISGEQKNIFAEEKKSRKGKGGKYHEEAKFARQVDTNRLKALQEVLVDLTIKSSS